ncbi:hypothetical protein GQX73_g3565 [Xylaria multiplex]|uniref:Protein kinase domain-containing protein n=1 Tax=Xylaria multiplex TaxID=323545 RepID=A0A7C8MUT9_9PEZI|nr:hypothetical protein GQX73_g3565 [Xylaria multiplex]
MFGNAFLDGKTFRYELEPEQPLPFKPLDSTDGESGHVGSVYRIAIPSSHFGEPNVDGYHEVALKPLFMPGGPEKDMFFEREREMLEKMRELQHPHLIQAHLTYRRGKDMGFMFPYAHGGNLASFWENHNPFGDPDSKPSLSFVSWALIQMKGLAHGLKELHDAKMRHGDIKPQNILFFERTEPRRKDLVIADVGLAKYYALYTHRWDYPRAVQFGSRRYEPPDVQRQTVPEGEAREVPHSRKYDLWSLGCVLLEFLIWLDSGSKGFMAFLSASGANRIGARFWQGQSVRQEIIESMSNLEHRLREKGQEYRALTEVLDLVQKRLLVEVDERADSASLFNEIEEIESRFSSGFTDIPSFPPQFPLRGGNDADDTAPNPAAPPRNVGVTLDSVSQGILTQMIYST